MTQIKYYPEDDKDFGYVGIKFPANGRGRSNTGFFNMSSTTEDQAVTNYINLLLTKKGERYMQPEYGIGLQYRLFEPNTEALRTEIEFEIYRQAAIWLPYVKNHKIEVFDKAEILGLNDPETGIQIVITFSVTEDLANKTITIFQQNGNVKYLVG